VRARRTEHRRSVLSSGVQVYVPYEADEAGGAVSRTFLDLAGNQVLKRGGHLLMRRMAGPDPLLPFHRSVLTDTGIDGRPARKSRTPMLARRSTWTKEKTPIPRRSLGRKHRLGRSDRSMRTKHIHEPI
jgi:hypothetical protein